MRLYKKGKAHSGPKLKKVKSREQAIAIGLSKARKKGLKSLKNQENRDDFLRRDICLTKSVKKLKRKDGRS